MIKNKVADGINKGTNMIKNFVASTSYVTLFIIFIVIMIILGISIYISKKIRYENTKCGDFTDSILIGQTKLKAVEGDDLNKPLNDFRIISAYNCCAIGGYRASFVKKCGLQNCLDLGARFLDFEIYDIQGIPYISTSTSLSFNYKESYNKYRLEDALNFINQHAFGNDLGNSTDPILLHFRIKSNNVAFFDSIAKILEAKFGETSGDPGRLLDPTKYGYNFTGNVTNTSPIETNDVGFNTSNENISNIMKFGTIPKPISFIKMSELSGVEEASGGSGIAKVIVIVKNYFKGENCNGMDQLDCFLPDNNDAVVGYNQYLFKGLGFNLDISAGCPNDNSDSNLIPYYKRPSKGISKYINNLSSSANIMDLNDEYIKIFTEKQANTAILDASNNINYQNVNNFNLFFLSIVIPETKSLTNYDGTKFLNKNFQIVTMQFQYIDEDLKKYLNYFKKSGFYKSFLIKDIEAQISTNMITIEPIPSTDAAASCSMTLSSIEDGEIENGERTPTYTELNTLYAPIKANIDEGHASDGDSATAQLIQQLRQTIADHNSNDACNNKIAVAANGWGPTGVSSDDSLFYKAVAVDTSTDDTDDT